MQSTHGSLQQAGRCSGARGLMRGALGSRGLLRTMHAGRRGSLAPVPAVLRSRGLAPVQLASGGVPARRLFSSRARSSRLAVHAVAAPELQKVLSKRFDLPNKSEVKVEVSEAPGEVQRIVVSTDLEAGRLLLHWGVEGGKDYKGGWRLPGERCRPDGTRQYKDRALQTPFKNGKVVIDLAGDEASDVLNFVLKDEATNTWYDWYGSNFAVALRTTVPTKAALPDVPKSLIDTWAWIRWDYQGRPDRSNKEANKDYEEANAEIEALLAADRPLAELQRVARGDWLYANYKLEVVDKLLGASTSKRAVQAPVPPRQTGDMPVVIPDELIAVQAYIMWEQAGKPQGADFGAGARNKIEEKLRSGMTLAQIEFALKNPKAAQEVKASGNGAAVAAPPAPAPPAAAAAAPPKPKEEKKAKEEKKEEKKAKVEEPKAAVQAPPAPPPPPPPPQKVEVGQGLGVATRNPLDMVKQKHVPVLSEDKRAKKAKPMDFLVGRAAVDPATKWRRVYQLGSKAELLVVVKQPEGLDGPTQVSLVTDTAAEVVLHWGYCKPGSRDWHRPPTTLRPEDTIMLEGGVACETPFVSCEDAECHVEIGGTKVPLQRVAIEVAPDMDIGGLTFVLRSADQTRWYRDANGNFFVPIPGKFKEDSGQDALGAFTNDLTRTIVDCEVNQYHWTLMHRYHKAADIINEVLDGFFEVDLTQALADIYTWLRYSATRQLTWQRNYNTQPRILSAAQERLTRTIADAHRRTTGEAQEWVRLMLSTVGRGGDGQRIRDEILHIMHRNHIPEKKGTWMEEWHQKLHNNTTPDDVPICKAYIAFLESNGDMNSYWRVLSDAGITRERLESYDRPVVTLPEFFRDKKEALIRDMRNYLGILKAVHSGADLQASAAAVGNSLPGSARGYLGYVTSHIGDNQILPFMEAAVEARTEIAPALPGNRDVLYLDLALEGAVRGAAERGVGSAGFGAAAFMQPLLQNLALSLGDNEEACYCLKAWQGLPSSVRSGGRPAREEALQAVAVINRIRRMLSSISDSTVARIGSFATALGRACKCDPWAVEIFAEEVVRGGPAFAISLVISSIEPGLRSMAELGAWQVISPHEVMGVVDVVEHLSEVQEKVYNNPTVLLVDNVTGEEEIPEGVVAVLTPDAPDVLSHVSVRARNMKVLFATCHDEEPLQQIREKKGQYLRFKPTAAGAVTWVSPSLQTIDSLSGGLFADMDALPPLSLKITIPKWCGKWVVGMDEFKDGVVGAKSKNIANLRGKIPDWIRVPAAVTVPFGSFEQALEEPENHAVRDQLKEVVKRLRAVPRHLQQAPPLNGNGAAAAAAGGSDSPPMLLARARDLAMQVQVPKALREQLAAALKASNIPVPENEERWGLALEALKGVWASKYNDRAYYSLRKCGIESDDVRMAVCIMRVVQARYAFVIHTKNPSNNDTSEVFCEMVKGLGESLVSGMVPGSSIAFTARKDDLDHPVTLSYASKSEGMFVRDSLIFRSDSNGEDLEGYAGAGLYESITMDPTEVVRVDYNDDPITRDEEFRRKIMASIAKVGSSIETALGTPQDIEGVVDPDTNITVVQTRPQV